MPPGSRLSVPAIARELGVSRSPVRDAVLHLVREGLGQETLNRGAVVRTLGREELASLYEAGEALEGMAAGLAAARCGPALRQRLSDLLGSHRRVVAASDVSRHLELDAAFHCEIRTAAANPVLSRMLEEIHGQVMLATHPTRVTGLAQAVEDHQDIVDATVSGDVEAIEAARPTSHLAAPRSAQRVRLRAGARSADPTSVRDVATPDHEVRVGYPGGAEMRVPRRRLGSPAGRDPWCTMPASCVPRIAYRPSCRCRAWRKALARARVRRREDLGDGHDPDRVSFVAARVSPDLPGRQVGAPTALHPAPPTEIVGSMGQETETGSRG
jgi:DNA-binding GntR family transcriptional regulator